ncbi:MULTISPECIES: Lrp/AsnC family transcriptional regulator [Pseudomonadaceae]|jgi:DNA-binding Lrp family transcriptional regulator|uniref:AsnC family transcriptional regulator n=1 Tax=Metapseudomonas otitidis TaxID=319939 RepID=A0A1I0UGJ7_9GAMM|nr:MULTISPECIES: Lrp/AsnC family transcriptional regulator [Pseudomonas]KIV72820.1 Leucine-responsive regulatory protein, regulator for leucine (or lrp) regulon and high-affinity branched-chain amino acid transport system [Pseudomonas sp. FeS53a]MBO2926867.1 Lrp/AsnC family transcriptional regulator [Pseudomonas otitidis]MCO7555620.1 Lrp/AsnC family transcriptional regulator [Pseudomonas otitidis]MCP1616737.1 DNA-binding Lrp family transcriptional regulator [Pseudomonas otitidis]MDG9780424.1 L
MKRILDPLDERILAELTANARIAHAELGTKVNLSRNAVRQRIERLERDGVIQGYTLKVGEGRRAAALISAVIFVYRHDRMRGEEVLRDLRAIPEVTQCDVMSGEFDLMLRVEAATPDRVHGVWRQIAGIPGVANTVTSFVLSAVI